ncbi:MAG: AAA family ATPase [Polyangiales bacterium]
MSESDVRAVGAWVKEQSGFIEPLMQQVRQRVVGQERMVERLLIGLLSGGHVLLEGVPGLAKTLAVNAVARGIAASFKRVQFTPDLLPADITGTVIYNQARGEFIAKQGPIFANLLLADEINRAPAKVQSALLEAMQEQQVTIGDESHALPQPFCVLATQNPIEQEGTYPLPEAQVDRFLLHVEVGYPRRGEERDIIRRAARQQLSGRQPPPQAEAQPAGVIEPGQILAARAVLAEIYLDARLEDYIVDLVWATREPGRVGLDDLRDLIRYGASPRAGIALNLAARAHAFMHHRGYVSPEDIKAVAPDVFRHRIVRSYEAEAEEVSANHIVRRVLEAVEVP